MLNREVIFFFHDNAPLHTVVAKETIKKCGYHDIGHATYSSDFVFNDYYLFSEPKFQLHGLRFTDNEEEMKSFIEHVTQTSPDKGLEMTKLEDVKLNIGARRLY